VNAYQPKTGAPCHCRRGVARDNCPDCEGTGQRINFAAIRARTLYDEAATLGLPMDNHESDLYLRCSPEADALVRRYDVNKTARRFVSQTDGAPWWDVPFAFLPWWRRRSGNNV
jgi:hypothetical protein